MTTETNNPPSPAPPGKLLRTARLVICIGLFVGVLVFGIFAFEQLLNPQASSPIASQFGTGDTAPQVTSNQQPGNFIKAMAQPDPTKFVPILRENHHPGEVAPFINAAPYGQPPYRQPNSDREVWEFCAYRTNQPHHPDDAFAHYNAQAALRGMTLQSNEPTSAKLPNGLRAVWSNGTQTLELTAWPTIGGEVSLQPPFNQPRGPLDWVVKYSYPVGAEPITPNNKVLETRP